MLFGKCYRILCLVNRHQFHVAHPKPVHIAIKYLIIINTSLIDVRFIRLSSSARPLLLCSTYQWWYMKLGQSDRLACAGQTHAWVAVELLTCTDWYLCKHLFWMSIQGQSVSSRITQSSLIWYLCCLLWVALLTHHFYSQDVALSKYHFYG